MSVNGVEIQRGMRTDSKAIRQRLMQKLSLNHIMDPSGMQRQKNYQTVIIWDWDDTLMASTLLSPYQSKILEPSIRKKLPKQIQ